MGELAAYNVTIFSSFQRIVLVSRATAMLSWFSLLFLPITDTYFQRLISKKTQTSNQLVNIVEDLAVKVSCETLKQSKKDGQVARNCRKQPRKNDILHLLLHV